MNLLSTIRNRLGLASVVLLTLAALTYLLSFWFTSIRPQGAFMRMGGACFVLWLAWPELERIPKWAYLSLILSVIVIAIKPIFFVYLFPLYILFLLTQPFGRKK